MKISLGLALIIYSFFFMTSCGGNQSGFGETDAASTSGTTTVGDGGGNTTSGGITLPPATTPSGYSTNDFFVTMASNNPFVTYTSQMSSAKVTSYGTKCSISSTDPLNNDMYCVIEAPELGVYYNGARLHVNMPAGMCDYIQTEPYWYYNQEIGRGPDEVYLSVLKETDPIDTTKEIVTDLRCASSASGTNTTCSSVYPNLKTKITSGDGDIECAYKCCVGKATKYYKRDIIQTASGTTIKPYELQAEKKWGNGDDGEKYDVSACLGGVGKTQWKTDKEFNEAEVEINSYDDEGFPVPNLQYAKLGYSHIYIVKSPLEAIKVSAAKKNYSNVSVANFWSNSTHTTFNASGTSSLPVPAFIFPGVDRTGNVVPDGNQFYTIDCLDSAFESKQRINLMIREWNVLDSLNAYVSTGTFISGTASGSPDSAGFAPTSCNGVSGTKCNKVNDVDNLAVPTYLTPVNRFQYFPLDVYL